MSSSLVPVLQQLYSQPGGGGLTLKVAVTGGKTQSIQRLNIINTQILKILALYTKLTIYLNMGRYFI